MFNKFFSSLIILTALLVFDGWGQSATVTLRPSFVDLSSPTSYSAVLMTLSSYSSNDAKYRLFSTNQYNCWNGTTFVSSSTYSAGPSVPGTPSSSSTFWIIYQRGNNTTTSASYRDRLGPSYSTNYQTVVLPAATSISSPFTLSGNVSTIGGYTLTNRYVVLGYSAISGGTLLSATSTELTSGNFSLVCDGTSNVKRIEIRDLNNTLMNTILSPVAGWTANSSVNEPTSAATGLSISPFSSISMTLNWTNGNGEKRLVVMKSGSAVNGDPVDGSAYTANSIFGSGGTTSANNFVVFNGTGNSVEVTGLTAGTTYHVAIYEYNSASLDYLTSSKLVGNETTVGSGPDPNVSFTGTDPGSAQIVVGTTKNIIYRTQLSVTGADVTMTDAGFTTSGNYTASDIQSGGFKLYYSTDATLDIGDIELGSISSLSDGTAGDLLLFTGFSRDFAVGSAYLFLTADVDAAATTLRTISTDTPGAADFTFSVTVTNSGSSFTAGSTHTFYKSPPTLTADNSSNTVDNNIDIAFSANAAWTAAITAVKIGGTGLTVTTDYEVINGMITLKPSGGNSLLTTEGSKLVTVEATGYTTASVTQQINAGAPTSNSTATISAALGLNTTRTVTVTAKDQYNNLVSGYTFKYDATITDATATTDESYTIDGTARTVTVTDINLTTVTDISGVATFTIALPSIVDANDGISVQVQLDNGTTNVGTAFSYIKQPVQVMISHLSVDYGAASDEFIVLFNNTNSDFDLNGYELQYFAASGGTGLNIPFATSTIIPSRKYYLLASNATVTVGSVAVTRDKSFTSGMGTSGQLQLRQASTPSNILYAVAWGTITSYVAGMTDAATWSGDGMISLTPSGTTYVRNDYNTSNTQYSHTLAANIAFIPNSSDAPLPVELTSFTAKSSGTTVTLNWETKTEVDNNGFEVERSTNGNWQKIGFVEGHGTANSPKYYSFVDNGAIGNRVQYRLKQIDNDGTTEYSSVVEVELNPTNFALYQNYPNPFNPSTMIRFSMPVSGTVALNVFNTLGEKVATLFNGQMEAGYHEVSFDAKNLPSGLYFYEIKTGDFSSIKKMILMK
ncbi:MAG: T9SS type A sorting domain-containing protein [Bacteroidetes bacterium]|nr:T9SS type A sorting domain-containing protein [Bacteroidota bacterium]